MTTCHFLFGRVINRSNTDMVVLLRLGHKRQGIYGIISPSWPNSRPHFVLIAYKVTVLLRLEIRVKSVYFHPVGTV